MHRASEPTVEVWMSVQFDAFMAVTVLALATLVTTLSENVVLSGALSAVCMMAHGVYSVWAARTGAHLSPTFPSPGVVRVLLSALVLTPLVWSCGPHQPAWVVALPAFVGGPLTSRAGRESLALVVLLAGTLGAHALAGASTTSLLAGLATLSATGILATQSSRVLKGLVADARAATEAKSRFIANMSHELRTPLAGVIGLTELALGTQLDDEPRELITTARASAEHLLTILNDILDLSKIEADKLTLEQTPFDVEAVVRQVGTVVQASAHSKSLDVRVVIELDGRARRLGDPVRLRQVLLNLGGNAVKFSSAGVIEIAAIARGDRVRFSVKDQGIGISEAAQARLFQPFTQADVSTTRRFGGTGLGLSISQSLAHKMGSGLELVSRPDHGSTFSFEAALPVVAEAPAQQRPLATINAPASTLRVLLADDNTVNQLIVGKMLRRAGHAVKTVGDGEQVLAALEVSGPFDVVLMDVQMPILDGLDTTRIIRRGARVSCADIPIIALTANAMSSDRDECLDAGMNAYLAKPVSEAALAEALERTAA